MLTYALPTIEKCLTEVEPLKMHFSKGNELGLRIFGARPILDSDFRTRGKK